MRTTIIAAYAGCGKTFLSENAPSKYSILDLDSSKYHTGHRSICYDYADAIEENIGKYDFILIAVDPATLMELRERNIQHVIVVPRQYIIIDGYPNMYVMKSLWFKRLMNRDNSHIKHLLSFIDVLDREWEVCLSNNYLTISDPVKILRLDSNTYLSDIINEIYEGGYSIK